MTTVHTKLNITHTSPCIFTHIHLSSCIFIHHHAYSSIILHLHTSPCIIMHHHAYSSIILHLHASPCIFIYHLASSCITMYLHTSTCEPTVNDWRKKQNRITELFILTNYSTAKYYFLAFSRHRWIINRLIRWNNIIYITSNILIK